MPFVGPPLPRREGTWRLSKRTLEAEDSGRNVTPAIWIPAWYELDQSIVLHDRDVFSFRVKRNQDDASEPLLLANCLDDQPLFEAAATVRRIEHSSFGELRAILAEGLDYSLITSDGTCIRIEAEESPGYVYSREETLKDTEFYVDLDNLVYLGPEDSRTLSGRSTLELKSLHAERKHRWSLLLGSAYPLD